MGEVPLPHGSQHIVPYVYYDDPRAATDYLCDVFGFEPLMALEWPDGRVAHAEVGMSGERVLIGGADARFGLASAKAHQAVHTVICVYVADVDAHYQHARRLSGRSPMPSTARESTRPEIWRAISGSSVNTAASQPSKS